VISSNRPVVLCRSELLDDVDRCPIPVDRAPIATDVPDALKSSPDGRDASSASSRLRRSVTDSALAMRSCPGRPPSGRLPIVRDRTPPPDATRAGPYAFHIDAASCHDDPPDPGPAAAIAPAPPAPCCPVLADTCSHTARNRSCKKAYILVRTDASAESI
jgi:hypothetical protein